METEDFDYVVGREYNIELFFTSNPDNNNKFPYRKVLNNPLQPYLVYNSSNSNNTIVSLLLNDVTKNWSEILKGKLNNIAILKYDFTNETVLYNSTIWIYLGLTLLGAGMVAFIVKLIISEFEELKGKKLKPEVKVEEKVNIHTEKEEEEKVSLNLPNSSGKIEIINFEGAPEDGFIKNDNVSSKVSGSYKFSNTEEFERQVSQIHPEGSHPSGNVPNNSAQDFLSFVKQVPQDSQSKNNP